MRKHRVLRTVLFLLFPCALAGQESGTANSRPAVVVVPIAVERAEPGAALNTASLTRMLERELAQSAQLRLLDSSQALAVLKSQEGASSMTDEMALRVGLLAGAQFVVTGTVLVQGRDAVFDIRFVDVERGEPTQSFQRTASARSTNQVVRDLAAQFTRELNAAESGAASTDSRIPVAASLAYARGLDYEKRGRRDAAATLFERALQLFPRHDQARSALERVRRPR